MKYTFFKTRNPKVSVYHKNGMKSDCSLANLKLLSRADLGKITGSQAKRRSVEKLSADGTPIEIYSSARQAAKENFMSYQTVIDFCNGKIKRKTAIDGNIYRWEERR
jgi:protein-tyrosine-phosphatase